MHRREFLRIAALASLSPLAGCVSSKRDGATRPGTSPAESPSGSPVEPPSETAPALGWRRIEAKGPDARRDYSFAASGAGSAAFLFGGRAGGKPLGDLWRFEEDAWQPMRGTGPAPRFGHNSALIGERLFVFGGQGGQGIFFNDLWAFDTGKESWRRLEEGGPSARYGAGGAAVGTRLAISHGFTNDGRFDDTWWYHRAWEDISPGEGTRPIERCLHRLVYLQDLDRLVLFGGQTNGVPFLGDTWLYDPAAKSWTEVRHPAPPPRNLYAAGATSSAVYMFGGNGNEALLRDLWRFDGESWSQLSQGNPRPSARGGIDFATVGGTMLLFGGSDASGELDDLWELTTP